MTNEITEADLRTRRLQSCVNQFPGCEVGELNQKCCRFPKACNPYGHIEAVQAGYLTDKDLEPADKAPIRMRNDTPITRGPIMREVKNLKALKVGSSFIVKTEFAELDAVQIEMDHRKVQLEAYVLQEHLADDYYEGRSEEYAFPSTWWDHFKETYGHRWWLNWWYERHGAKYDLNSLPVRVKVERYANYPEADIPIGQLGRPVPYENVRRLDAEEVRRMDDEKQANVDDVEKHDSVVVYSLVPETFDQLVNETGIQREYFETEYEWNETHGFQTKIYIVPTEGLN